MNIYWSDILSLIYNSVLHERVDVLTVEARFGDLVVPGLSSLGDPALHVCLRHVGGGGGPEGVLTHVGAVQLGSLLVVPEVALVCPPLGGLLQLSAPHLYMYILYYILCVCKISHMIN